MRTVPGDFGLTGTTGYEAGGPDLPFIEAYNGAHISTCFGLLYIVITVIFDTTLTGFTNAVLLFSGSSVSFYNVALVNIVATAIVTSDNYPFGIYINGLTMSGSCMFGLLSVSS